MVNKLNDYKNSIDQQMYKLGKHFDMLFTSGMTAVEIQKSFPCLTIEKIKQYRKYALKVGYEFSLLHEEEAEKLTDEEKLEILEYLKNSEYLRTLRLYIDNDIEEHPNFKLFKNIKRWLDEK